MFIDAEKDLGLVPHRFDQGTATHNASRLNEFFKDPKGKGLFFAAGYFAINQTLLVPAVAGLKIHGAGMGKDACYSQYTTHNANATVIVWVGNPDSRMMTIRGAFCEIDGIMFQGCKWDHQTMSPPDWPEHDKRASIGIAFEEDPDGGTLMSWSGKNHIRASFFLLRTALLATYMGDEHDAHSDEILFDHVITYGVQTVYRSECLQAVGSYFNHLNIYGDLILGQYSPTTVFDIKRGGNICVGNMTTNFHGGTVLKLGDSPGKSFVGQDNGSFVFNNIKVDTGMFSRGITKDCPFRLIDMVDDVECFIRMTGHIGHANFDTSSPWYNPNGEHVIVTKGNHYNIGLDIWGLDDVNAGKYPMAKSPSSDAMGSDSVDQNVFDDAFVYVTPYSQNGFVPYGQLQVKPGIHNKESFYINHQNSAVLLKENVKFGGFSDYSFMTVINPEGINPEPHGYAGLISSGEWISGSTNWIGGSFEILMNGGRICVAKMVGNQYVISARTINEMSPNQSYLVYVKYNAQSKNLSITLDNVETVAKFDNAPINTITSKLVLFGRHAHKKIDQSVAGYIGDLAFWDRLLKKEEEQYALNQFRAKWGVN